MDQLICKICTPNCTHTIFWAAADYYILLVTKSKPLSGCIISPVTSCTADSIVSASIDQILLIYCHFLMLRNARKSKLYIVINLFIILDGFSWRLVRPSVDTTVAILVESIVMSVTSPGSELWDAICVLVVETNAAGWSLVPSIENKLVAFIKIADVLIGIAVNIANVKPRCK